MDTLIAIDKPAPDFELTDLIGNRYRLTEQHGRVIILNFWSAECPWSERADQEMLSYLQNWGVRAALWTIAANANEPLEMLQQVSGQRGLPVVLHDAHQQVADLYQAQTTPHIFVIDQFGLLRYQGAVNDITFRQRTPTRYYLQAAVEAVLAGRRPDPEETPPYGCTIVRYAA